MIGILPAAGQATRFNGFPKFLLPVPEGNLMGLHCRRMHDAGANRVLIGSGIHNAETISRYRPADTEMYMGGATMAETVLNAREDCDEEHVLFGMPDTYWNAPNVYASLSESLRHCDVAVALWKIRDDQRGSVGQVENIAGRIARTVDKDPSCPFPWLWGAIAWRPIFWNFIKPDMPHIGYALQPAIDAGIPVWGVTASGDYWDCGTFPQYAKLCSTFAEVSHVTA